MREVASIFHITYDAAVTALLEFLRHLGITAIRALVGEEQLQTGFGFSFMHFRTAMKNDVTYSNLNKLTEAKKADVAVGAAELIGLCHHEMKSHFMRTTATSTTR